MFPWRHVPSLIWKWVRLPAPQRRLLGSALRLLMELQREFRTQSPLEVWGRRLGPPSETSPDPEAEIAGVVEALELCRRYLPQLGNCLEMAFAAQILLRDRGCQSEVRIGVTRDPQGTPTAHAWVEFRGRVILGAVPDLGSYSELLMVPTSGEVLAPGR